MWSTATRRWAALWDGWLHENPASAGTKVFYTAHGFHFYKGAPKKNWLIWYPVEKFMCRHTDKLITITQEDYGLASAKFPTQVERIHGVVQILQSIVSCPKPNVRRCGAS